jgi:(S)-mandelate dehydrogenase
MIAPTGLNFALWPKGDILLTRAAEEVAAASKGDLWFQLYIVLRKLAAQMVRRAEAAGYSTLV